jgi:hypothetical protein
MNLELRELYFTGMQTCGAETREFFKHFSNMKYHKLIKTYEPDSSNDQEYIQVV